ncbi:MAG: hypothetical protein MUF64_14060 [Polyangiaceae bacterium]|jgi:hypothetical protein|nr:hypothetical protein [Polyangiaceae bacterium]
MEGGALAVAEKLARFLARSGVESALIGAVALAAHRYPRSTEDIDLAVGMDPRRLEELAQQLRNEGFSTEVSLPDDLDPLGGVLRVQAEGVERIEIVNFCNPPAGGFPALIEAALRKATPLREGATLRVVTLQHLILFKLYAGGVKSKNDVLELMSRNPELDLNELRAMCQQFRMDRRLELWLRDLQSTNE